MQAESTNHQHLRSIIATTLLFIMLPSAVTAASVGGSLSLTSDYLVRGISRSNHQASPQADVHVAFDNGFDAGIFAASVQVAPDQQHNTEVSAFVGYGRDISDAWHARTVVNHYSYPWNPAGAKYDYDEVNLDVAYEQWLTFSAMYSPNAPRFLADRGLISVTEKSLAISTQLPVAKRLYATAGLGYAHLAGPYSDEYNYWAAGGIYAWESVSISLQYVDTTASAGQLYRAAAHQRVAGTLIWRF